MTITARVLIPPKLAEATQTTQYSSGSVVAIIDKFTATNVSGAVATLSVNLLNASGVADDTNLIVKLKALQPAETYLFPELVGQVLSPNNAISTLASASSSINIRASGREVT
jgi:hypothetical protein